MRKKRYDYMTRISPRPASTKAKRTHGRTTDRPPHHRALDVEKGTIYTPREVKKLRAAQKNIKDAVASLLPRVEGKKLVSTVSSSDVDFEDFGR